MLYTTLILNAAKAAHVSGTLLLAICTHESGLRNVMVEEDGGSPTYGVCQIKYETAQMLGFKGEPMDLMLPTVNVKWAARYVKYQYSRYGDDWCKIAASFNSGTYNESKVVPGKPKNLKYVRNVQKNIDPRFRYRLSCDIRK